jgi:hypothetical protein
VTGGNIDEHDVVQRNITYAGNVLEYCDFGIEIFFTLEDDAGYGSHRMENVQILDNWLLYSGYGWSSRQDKEKAEYSSAYQGHNDPNTAKGFSMTNNVFYLSTGSLIRTNAVTLPEMDGNTYIQNDMSVLAFWPSGEGYIIMYAYDNNATTTVRDVLGDKSGIVLVGGVLKSVE